MSDKSSPPRTSYAYQHRADLPGATSKLDRTPEVAPRFGDAPAKVEARGSEMVKKDRPHPAPRPTPFLALTPDRASFNARWTREHEAANQQPEDLSKEARRRAFKAKRQAQTTITRLRERQRNRAK